MFTLFRDMYSGGEDYQINGSETLEQLTEMKYENLLQIVILFNRGNAFRAYNT
jgi:hypothetical protein